MKKRVQHLKRSRQLNSADLAQVGGSATLSVGNLLLSGWSSSFDQETDNKIREMANETYVNR